MRELAGQHYMELIPDQELIKQSDRATHTTLERIEKMKLDVLLKTGKITKLKGIDKDEETFKHQEFPDHPQGEKISLSNHLENARLIREYRQKQRG